MLSVTLKVQLAHKQHALLHVVEQHVQARVIHVFVLPFVLPQGTHVDRAKSCMYDRGIKGIRWQRHKERG
jgi:hypothetical protein